MMLHIYIICSFVLLMFVFGFYMVQTLGWIRGVGAALSRVLWLLPVLFMFFPRNVAHEVGDSVSNTVLRVLIDDSDSMTGSKERKKLVNAKIRHLEDLCRASGCQLKLTRVSEVESRSKRGYSYLNEALSVWLLSIGGDPWVFISDGGDSQPSKPWNSRITGEGKTRGLIIGFDDMDQENVWVEKIDLSPLAFEHKNIPLQVKLRRAVGSDDSKLPSKTVQVQIASEQSVIDIQNVEFDAGQDNVTQDFLIPPLSRGQHTLFANVIPSPREIAVWDNQKNFDVDVLPNTVGVLHVLGSPSWDGRFLRRFLKSEPKFDLISFYILRDPWDSQLIDERELSLIPFPVDRLFREELQNFRVLIIQNFSMFQFMIAEHQENLVRFVQNGGGLLFIGGPRALGDQDMRSSPLRAILPFEDQSPEEAKVGDFEFQERAQISSNFQENREFEIKLASPDAEERTQASIYEEFMQLKPSLESIKGLKGMHLTQNFKFRKGASTRILDAKGSDGVSSPLMIASYPDQGRAIWLFTDSFWQVAMSKAPLVTRDLYNQVFLTSLRWLMRDEARAPVVVRDVIMSQETGDRFSWSARVTGSNAKFFRDRQNIKVNLCNMEIPENSIQIHATSSENLNLHGEIRTKISKNFRCKAKFEFMSQATGKLIVETTAIVPAEFSDKEIQGSLKKLYELQDLTQAAFVMVPRDGDRQIEAFVDRFTRKRPEASTFKIKNVRDHFWIFEEWYGYILISFAIIEVLIRRWDKIFAIN